jgi:hypothetical protein
MYTHSYLHTCVNSACIVCLCIRIYIYEAPWSQATDATRGAFSSIVRNIAGARGIVSESLACPLICSTGFSETDYTILHCRMHLYSAHYMILGKHVHKMGIGIFDTMRYYSLYPNTIKAVYAVVGVRV